MDDKVTNHENKALDAIWFEKLSTIKIKYNKLVSPDFLPNTNKGDWGNVLSQQPLPLTFSALIKEDIYSTEQKIDNLRLLIEADTEADTVVKKLWLKKMEGMQEQVSLLSDLQVVNNSSNKTLSIDAVQVKMDKVMGGINQTIFKLTIAELRTRLQQKDKEHVLTDCGLSTFAESILPYEAFLKDYPRVEFDDVIPIEQSQIYTVDELKLYMEKALQTIGLQDTWQIKIDRTKKYHRVQVSYKKREIIIPSVEAYNLNGKKYIVTANKAFRLLVHEIGTHALRSTNGFNSSLKLLSVGLDDYLIGEEGVATFREQQYLGTKKYFEGFQSYLAIGLALGIDQHNIKRSPLEVYNLLYKINLALFYKNDTFAKYSAWKRILRTFISFPNLTDTIVNTKDLVYRDGNIRIHKLYTSNQYNDDVINAGVYDPSNMEHVFDLQSLGII